MSKQNNPVSRQFDLLLDQTVPRKVCPHIEGLNLSGGRPIPRMLCSWSADRLDCPTCASFGRLLMIRQGFTCPECREPSNTMALFSRAAGAITLAVGVCSDCGEGIGLPRDPETYLSERLYGARRIY